MMVKRINRSISLFLFTAILSLLVLPLSTNAQKAEYMAYSTESLSKKSDETKITEVTYNGYSFNVPEYWGDPVTVGNEMYFMKDSGTLPLLYMTYIENDFYTEQYKDSKLRYTDYFNVLEESLNDFISFVFDSCEFDDSTKTFIGGKPALTRKGTCNMAGDDDAFVAQFIDDNNIYVIMLVDYQDSGSDIFDDINELLDSFKEID
ncbi:hypothetical protein SAMN04487884_12928 [Butyrivibrio fibrisolvens]|uniref:Uncharacterized protein n=1 Tax=Butyrivibrio fibrisolvens TaxID=831 RepID=A0A1H9WCU4_BUTFI|nr:hypothetical protein [Butyrivibrio fibrisolvens]SES31611.1 hypothetical protein SAMN04487884_12928 [Butyrivibrio fibrisolvens]